MTEIGRTWTAKNPLSLAFGGASRHYMIITTDPMGKIKFKDIRAPGSLLAICVDNQLHELFLSLQALLIGTQSLKHSSVISHLHAKYKKSP